MALTTIPSEDIRCGPSPGNNSMSLNNQWSTQNHLKQHYSEPPFRKVELLALTADYGKVNDRR